MIIPTILFFTSSVSHSTATIIRLSSRCSSCISSSTIQIKMQSLFQNLLHLSNIGTQRSTGRILIQTPRVDHHQALRKEEGYLLIIRVLIVNLAQFIAEWSTYGTLCCITRYPGPFRAKTNGVDQQTLRFAHIFLCIDALCRDSTVSLCNYLRWEFLHIGRVEAAVVRFTEEIVIGRVTVCNERMCQGHIWTQLQTAIEALGCLFVVEGE
mmetsp:Transcript_4482/g.6850  ORF Transcript_4482/g.6850 Transcript_4482/m.6850 type:complete len:210 (-) Transcript_4482:331-960(-)